MAEEVEKDQVVHALGFDDRVRVIVARMSETVQHAVRVHQTHATASAALGRALIAARMMRATLKSDERVTLQLRGNGPVGLVLTRAEAEGDVYGSIQQPEVHLPPRSDGKLDVGGAIGSQGTLTVVRDRPGYDPYVGTTELVSGEVGEDVAHYLLTSEQIGSAVGAGVLMGPDGEVRGAGGFLVQILGGLDDDSITQLEGAIARIGQISRVFEAGATAGELLKELCGSDYRELASEPVRYHAPHDREYYLSRLRALDHAAMQELFEGDASIELTCEFTRQTWRFSRDEFPVFED